MAQISFTDLQNGIIPDASDFNDRFNALKNRINNGMEQDNLATGSVTTAKIVNGSVTALKIDQSDDFAWTGEQDFSGATVTGLGSYADATEVKAGTETTKGPSVATMIAHEGMVKGWISMNGTGTPAINDSYNVSGIVDSGTGVYTISWDTDFGSANYACVASASSTSVSPTNVAYVAYIAYNSKAAGSVKITSAQADNGASADVPEICVIAIGDR